MPFGGNFVRAREGLSRVPASFWGAVGVRTVGSRRVSSRFLLFALMSAPNTLLVTGSLVTPTRKGLTQPFLLRGDP